MSATLSFYDENANQLAKQYNSVEFETVHGPWQSYWPLNGEKVLDVGAGCGRDAKWLAENGCEVIALEPSSAMRMLGKQITGSAVTWLDDSLPALTKTVNLDFALMLFCSVRFGCTLLQAIVNVPFENYRTY